MEIRCEECQAVIHIPDDRVPPSTTFRLNCPRCRRKIFVHTKNMHKLEERPTNASPYTPAVGAAYLGQEDTADEPPDAMDYLSPGQLAALLCMNQTAWRSEVKTMLEGLGYVVDMPTTAAHALQRLRFNQYHLILLDDEFEEVSPNPLAGYLATLNMNTRREMFVVLIGQRFKTADHLQAFMESVDLLLHPDDLPQLVTFLSRGLREHERFYKVFNECLIEAGKKI